MLRGLNDRSFISQSATNDRVLKLEEEERREEQKPVCL